MPTADVPFETWNPRPGRPVVDGDFRIASLNVLNFFTGLDNGSPRCGPRNDEHCRGADNPREFSRQLEKTVTALAMMDADVIGLIELENNARQSIATLADALNTRLGGDVYEYIDTGVIGNDVIKTGFLFRKTSATPVGEFALLDSSFDADFNDDKNRPALAQTFAAQSGARLTIALNHLKSKGSDCEAEGDPNRGDGQGNCAGIRTAAADALARWLQSDPTGSRDDDFLIIGDLNAYLQEHPLTALRDAGLVSLLDDTRPVAYSFLYDGQIGALDHAVASPSLARQVVETLEWHVNADEPPLLDYNLEHGRDPDLFDARSPYRSSDHDPIIVGLDLTP